MANTPARILVVEDDRDIADLIRLYLDRAGHVVDVALTGDEALGVIRETPPDLLILDVMLPDEYGFSMCRWVRQHPRHARVPIIMLTARTSTRDTVEGLESGASAYIRKPFTFEELLARVRSRLREVPADAGTTIVHGEVSLDLLSRRALVGGREVELSAREFALAEQFLRSPGMVLSREQLLSRVWEMDFDPGANVVDVDGRYRRGKRGAQHIATGRGAGYRGE